MARILVAYFSASGTTRQIARQLSECLNVDLYEIKPKIPYSADDLNWNAPDSRSSVEMRDHSSRPTITNRVENMEQYDIVFIGFPVWWYIAPTIVNTFIESHDLKGKTLVTFATSGGSGIGNCEKNLKLQYPQYKWAEGKLLNHGVSEAQAKEWLAQISK